MTGTLGADLILLSEDIWWTSNYFFALSLLQFYIISCWGVYRNYSMPSGLACASSVGGLYFVAQWLSLSSNQNTHCAPLYSGLPSSLVSAHNAHRDNLRILCETHFLLDACSSLINLKEAKRITHSSPITFP